MLRVRGIAASSRPVTMGQHLANRRHELDRNDCGLARLLAGGFILSQLLLLIESVVVGDQPLHAL